MTRAARRPARAEADVPVPAARRRRDDEVEAATEEQAIASQIEVAGCAVGLDLGVEEGAERGEGRVDLVVVTEREARQAERQLEAHGLAVDRIQGRTGTVSIFALSVSSTIVASATARPSVSTTSIRTARAAVALASQPRPSAIAMPRRARSHARVRLP